MARGVNFRQRLMCCGDTASRPLFVWAGGIVMCVDASVFKITYVVDVIYTVRIYRAWVGLYLDKVVTGLLSFRYVF